MSALLLGSAALVAGCGGEDTQRAASHDVHPTRPTVTVTPTAGPAGSVFTFRGRGWRPRVIVEALHGPYCPGPVCITLGLVKRFRPDEDGEFVFRFTEGRSAAGLPPPAAAGNGPVTFDQFKGRRYRSGLIRVRPRYRVLR